jgi:hypothetical protein
MHQHIGAANHLAAAIRTSSTNKVVELCVLHHYYKCKNGSKISNQSYSILNRYGEAMLAARQLWP